MSILGQVVALLDRFIGRLPTVTPASTDLLPLMKATGKRHGKATVADILALGSGGGLPGVGARVYFAPGTEQTLTTGTATAITMNTERYDNGGLWDAGSPTRLTAPSDGLYAIGGSLRFASVVTTAGARGIFLRINGATYICQHFSAGVNNSSIPLAIHSLYRLSSSDYVELMAYHTQGSDLALSAAGNTAHEFYMEKLRN